MRVLALDTTTRAGSVAVVEPGRIVVERGGDPARTHAERLPADILSALHEAGMDLTAIDVFAVAAGPGSFTGLRVGIATIQGLALVRGRRVVPVSALEALAHAGSREVSAGALIGAWMDAHRRDVFSALYRVADAAPFSRGRLVEVESSAVGTPASTLERWRAGPRIDVFIGDGAVMYGGVIGDGARVIAPPPLAGTIGLMAVERARAGETIDPAGIQPLYVRRPDAEIDREKKAAHWIVEPLTSPADLDAILAIEEASFTNPWTREMYLAELENEGVSFFYLARDAERRVIGFCSFWRVLDELHINNLAVLPGHRRQGVASALLAGVLQEGERLGAGRATLEVRRSNLDARRLYERFGFSVAAIRPGYYSHPIEDALVLRRDAPAL